MTRMDELLVVDARKDFSGRPASLITSPTFWCRNPRSISLPFGLRYPGIPLHQRLSNAIGRQHEDARRNGDEKGLRVTSRTRVYDYWLGGKDSFQAAGIRQFPRHRHRAACAWHRHTYLPWTRTGTLRTSCDRGRTSHCAAKSDVGVDNA